MRRHLADDNDSWTAAVAGVCVWYFRPWNLCHIWNIVSSWAVCSISIVLIAFQATYISTISARRRLQTSVEHVAYAALNLVDLDPYFWTDQVHLGNNIIPICRVMRDQIESSSVDWVRVNFVAIPTRTPKRYLAPLTRVIDSSKPSGPPHLKSDSKRFATVYKLL